MGVLVDKCLTYWWKARANFGDRLTRLLTAHFSGIEVEWSEPGRAQLVGVGSLLDHLAPDWRGVVAGTGKLHATTVVPRRARVVALRGKLTAKGVRGTYALGDPGLLTDELCSRPESQYAVGVVPHWSDTGLVVRFAYLNPLVIDAGQDPMTVIQQIGSCRQIVSSSLHGIVVADAFGIPRQAEKFPLIDSAAEGGTFKFDDYASALGERMVWGRMHQPDRLVVEAVQADLFDVYRSLGRTLRAA